MSSYTTFIHLLYVFLSTSFYILNRYVEFTPQGTNISVTSGHIIYAKCLARKPIPYGECVVSLKIPMIPIRIFTWD